MLSIADNERRDVDGPDFAHRNGIKRKGRHCSSIALSKPHLIRTKLNHCGLQTRTKLRKLAQRLPSPKNLGDA